MDMQFLEKTKMLNYQSVGIQKLINEKRWGELSEFDKIKAIMDLCKMKYLWVTTVMIH